MYLHVFTCTNILYVQIHTENILLCLTTQHLHVPSNQMYFITKQYILCVHLHVDTLFVFFDTMVIQWYVVIHTVGT